VTIERTVDGMADFWIDKIEELDKRPDFDIEKKMKLAKAASQEVREMMRLNLSYKQLLMKSPDVARNTEIVLQLGSPKKADVEDGRAAP